MRETSKRVVVGVAGYARVGKDTFGGYLVKDHGFERVAFADAVRWVAYDLYADVRELVDEMGWERAKSQHHIIRERLVDVGCVVREHVAADAWIQSAKRQMSNDLVVITDVRFPNEVSWIHDMGGMVLRIKRHGYGPADSKADTALDQTNLDAIVFNNGTLDDLRGIAYDFINMLGGDTWDGNLTKNPISGNPWKPFTNMACL